MILVFDASIEGFSVGVFRLDGTLIHSVTNSTPYSHTEMLVPTIQGVLSKSNVQFQDLTQIVTTKGPGSFTGIRVGLATAVGLRTALNIPVMAVNTLLALVHSSILHQHVNASQLSAVIDTKCGEFYHQGFSYKDGAIMSETLPRSLPLKELISVVGSGVIITDPSSTSMLENVSCVTTPLTLEGVLSASKDSANEDLQPLYVRSANITHPKLNA
jgi:tRNA threonylcarbamoyl adenosine modification protein YeaZ